MNPQKRNYKSVISTKNLTVLGPLIDQTAFRSSILVVNSSAKVKKSNLIVFIIRLSNIERRFLDAVQTKSQVWIHSEVLFTLFRSSF